MSEDEEPRSSRGGAIAAFVFLIVLVIAGVWIAQSLVAMVRQQNCVMSGRHDCLQIPAETIILPARS